MERVARRSGRGEAPKESAVPFRRNAASSDPGLDALGNQTVQHALRAAPAGQAIAPALRSDLERSFGRSLGDLRVQTGAEADRVTGALGAAALTHGRDLWFGAGRYRPDTLEGRILAGHEVAHALQQERGGEPPPVAAEARHEHDASRAAISAALGRRARVTEATGVGAACMTPEELEHMLQTAQDQMKSEGLHKNLVGAAGEGSYMGALTNRGVANVNLNKFSTAMNTPYLDVISSEGVAQVKVRTLDKVKDYVQDFSELVDPTTHKKGVATGTANSEKAANVLAENRAAIQAEGAQGAWPKGLKPNATPEEILQFMRKESVLAIPADHVDAVRAAAAEQIRLDPKAYGLEPGPNLEAEIEALTSRIQSVGLTRKSLGTLETNFRAGTGTTATSVDEVVTPADTPSAKPKPNEPVSDPAKTAEPTTGEPAIGEPAPSGWGRAGNFLGKWGGRALAVWGGYSEYKKLRQEGHGPLESLVGGLGMGGGYLAAPAMLKGMKGTGIADLVINLANAGLQLAGAPRGVTDVSSTVASATPSSFIANVLSQGSRSWLNILSGDLGGIDKQVGEMQQGKAGAPLQGYSLLTELGVQLATGKDADEAFLKVGSIGKDSSAKRIGDFLGDAAWTAKEGYKATSDILGSVFRGEDADMAIIKAASKLDIPQSSAFSGIKKLGDKLGDESYKFVNTDMPEAIDFAKQDIKAIAEAPGATGKLKALAGVLGKFF